MRYVNFILVDVLQTLLRVLPFPCRTGLLRIGSPGRDAPVFLTCNFRLTVERVRRALRGMDAYLLVANSRGVNVWCAATGGIFTNDSVVSVLKTSGVGDLVDHRRVILPQLAATGIEGEVIREKTGWEVVWGPVYAASIPPFLENGLKKPAEMRTVRFRWPRRLEMAVAWAFPISLISLLVFPLWRAGALPLAGFVWGWAILMFLGFPLYEGRLRSKKKRIGFVFFDFGEWGLPLILWALFIVALAAHAARSGDFSWAPIVRWGLASLAVVLILSIDMTGSTPAYKSGLHPDRLLRVVLDESRCKAAGSCERVCPVGVFQVDYEHGLASLPGAERCVQCGACIVQCPLDALCFEAPGGRIVPPHVVRKFKLNMLGTRRVAPGG